MASTVQTGIEGIAIESVDELYRQFTLMDVPEYYHEGGENPFAGRCRVIPQKATYYALAPVGDEQAVTLARMLLKGVGKRRKVREVICEKHEINYNQFASVGQIMVLYV